MSNQMIPIDPSKKDDIYYRYKMPALQTKVEGSGNGIKTVIPNIHDICIAINRPEEVLMKFYQFELGAQRNVSEKDDKFLLMGSHTSERMQEKLYDFIRKFVLCKKCANPETIVELEASKKGAKISMVCGACGKNSNFDDHRVMTFMTQYFQKHPEETKAAKGAAAARKKEEDQAAAAAAEGSAPAGLAGARKAPKAVVQSDMADHRENPMDIFARDLKECGDNTEELINRVVRLLTQYSLPEAYGPSLLLNGMIIDHTDDLLATMQRHVLVLKRFSTVAELFLRSDTFEEKELTSLLSREQKIQLRALEDCARICKEKYTLDKLPVMVFLLFVEGVLKDTSIAVWARGPEKAGDEAAEGDEKSKKKDKFAEARLTLAPIVEWLGLTKTDAAAQAE